LRRVLFPDILLAALLFVLFLAPAACGVGAISGSDGAQPAVAGVAGTSGGVGAAGADGVAGTTGAAGTGAAGDGATPIPDAAVPQADGGAPPVTVDGKAWEMMYPRDKRRMLIRDEGKSTLHYVNLGDPSGDWTAKATGWARGMQLVGNDVVLGGRSDGYEEYDLKTGAILKQVKAFGNTQSAYRMANGETMLTVSGGSLVFLEPKTDAMKAKIQYQGYGYVRMARPTPQGTFLVPCDQTLIEGDDKGNVLWKATGEGWGHIWEAIKLPSGNIVLGTAFGASLDVIDGTTHKVIQRIGTKKMPEAGTVKPNFFAEFQVLPNGNFITSNWQGHGGGNGGSGVQILEFSPDGALVWQWKQDAAVYSSIQGVMVLDGLDTQLLHTQAVNGQWTPVK
jgi:hypothetical protein